MQKFRAQFRIVVDFPIEHHPDATVFICNGLMAACEIDDAQAAEAEPYPRAYKNAFVIRPAVNDRLVHAVYQLLPDFGQAVVLEDSCNAAHELYPLRAV